MSAILHCHSKQSFYNNILSFSSPQPTVKQSLSVFTLWWSVEEWECFLPQLRSYHGRSDPSHHCSWGRPTTVVCEQRQSTCWSGRHHQTQVQRTLQICSAQKNSIFSDAKDYSNSLHTFEISDILTIIIHNYFIPFSKLVNCKDELEIGLIRKHELEIVITW